MVKFCVITKIRSLEGILADDFVLDLPEGKVVWDGLPDRLIPDDRSESEVKVPVFEEGEILVCDDMGIEIGKMRKPWKWDVEYKMFDNVDEAVKKAMEIIEER